MKILKVWPVSWFYGVLRRRRERIKAEEEALAWGQMWYRAAQVDRDMRENPHLYPGEESPFD
jgi:hypothetical protein